MAFRLTNEEGYSLSVAAWLGDDDYDYADVEGPYISATGLLKPIRMIVLEQRLKDNKTDSDDLETIDISRYVPSRLGTAIHAGIEATWNREKKYKRSLRLLGYPEKIIDKIRVNPSEEERKEDIIPVYMEQRSFKEIEGYTIGGKYDFVGNGVLEDFKSMGVYGYIKGDKDEEQRLQGSIYRWLNPDIITADHMLIQHIFTDWSKLEATIKKRKNYPTKRIVAKRLELLSLDETEAWIRKKLQSIKKLQKVSETELPLCCKKELWQDDTKYKYYKNPEKTARSTANFDDYPSAHARLLKDGKVGIIKEFIGKVRRCGYCPGFEICTQKDLYADADLLMLP